MDMMKALYCSRSFASRHWDACRLRGRGSLGPGGRLRATRAVRAPLHRRVILLRARRGLRRQDGHNKAASTDERKRPGSPRGSSARCRRVPSRQLPARLLRQLRGTRTAATPMRLCARGWGRDSGPGRPAKCSQPKKPGFLVHRGEMETPWRSLRKGLKNTPQLRSLRRRRHDEPGPSRKVSVEVKGGIQAGGHL